MFHFLEYENRCEITINRTFKEKHIKKVVELFEKKYECYDVRLLHLYTIPAELVKVLSRYQKKQNILLSSDGSRLVRYLHRFDIEVLLLNDKSGFEVKACDVDLMRVDETLSIERFFDEWINVFLEKIYEIYGYDYRAYDKKMLKRRVEFFMIKHSIKDIKQFVELILYNRVAFKLFFLEISINVSEFFRDPLSMKEIAKVLVKFRHNYSVRIWSAGVSRGEEAYSLAIVLDNLNMLDRTLIYATDFNPVVIEEAKNALYGMKEYKKAEENYQELENSQKFADYFIFYDSFVEVKPALKKKIMFFVHNLQNSSSFNEFDLIECRNVLIYFKIAFQEKIFKLLYDSLKFGGYLFLGLNEFIVPSYEYKFEVYDSKYKIFKKVR